MDKKTFICGHPELIPTMWNQLKPEPCEMIGSCEHNMVCPVCGFGWGCAPDPCNEKNIDSQTHNELLEESLTSNSAVWTEMAKV